MMLLSPFYRENNGGGNIYQWGRIFACRDSGFVQQGKFSRPLTRTAKI
jgi:hypothetical protein